MEVEEQEPGARRKRESQSFEQAKNEPIERRAPMVPGASRDPSPAPSAISGISSRRAIGQKESLSSQSIRMRRGTRKNKRRAAGEKSRRERGKNRRCAAIPFPSLRPLVLLLALQFRSLSLFLIESCQIKGQRERHERKPVHGKAAKMGEEASKKMGAASVASLLHYQLHPPFSFLSLCLLQPDEKLLTC